MEGEGGEEGEEGEEGGGEEREDRGGGEGGEKGRSEYHFTVSSCQEPRTPQLGMRLGIVVSDKWFLQLHLSDGLSPLTVRKTGSGELPHPLVTFLSLSSVTQRPAL